MSMVLFSTNDSFHFGSLHRSMLTLFRVVTFDDWTDVMYINMYGCKEWGYKDDDSLPKPRTCKESHYYLKDSNMNWLAAFFFIIFVLIGGLILLTLFISVVQVSIEDSTSKFKAKQESFQRMVEHAAEDGIGRHACEGFLAAFDRIDQDNSGSLSVDELMDALIAVGFQISRAQMKEIIHEMDEGDDDGHKDGEVDPFEFYKFIRKLTEQVGEEVLGKSEMTKSFRESSSSSSTTTNRQVDASSSSRDICNNTKVNSNQEDDHHHPHHLLADVQEERGDEEEEMKEEFNVDRQLLQPPQMKKKKKKNSEYHGSNTTAATFTTTTTLRRLSMDSIDKMPNAGEEQQLQQQQQQRPSTTSIASPNTRIRNYVGRKSEAVNDHDDELSHSSSYRITSDIDAPTPTAGMMMSKASSTIPQQQNNAIAITLPPPTTTTAAAAMMKTPDKLNTSDDISLPYTSPNTLQTPPNLKNDTMKNVESNNNNSNSGYSPPLSISPPLSTASTPPVTLAGGLGGGGSSSRRNSHQSPPPPPKSRKMAKLTPKRSRNHPMKESSIEDKTVEAMETMMEGALVVVDGNDEEGIEERDKEGDEEEKGIEEGKENKGEDIVKRSTNRDMKKNPTSSTLTSKKKYPTTVHNSKYEMKDHIDDVKKVISSGNTTMAVPLDSTEKHLSSDFEKSVDEGDMGAVVGTSLDDANLPEPIFKSSNNFHSHNSRAHVVLSAQLTRALSSEHELTRGDGDGYQGEVGEGQVEVGECSLSSSCDESESNMQKKKTETISKTKKKKFLTYPKSSGNTSKQTSKQSSRQVSRRPSFNKPSHLFRESSLDMNPMESAEVSDIGIGSGIGGSGIVVNRDGVTRGMTDRQVLKHLNEATTTTTVIDVIDDGENNRLEMIGGVNFNDMNGDSNGDSKEGMHYALMAKQVLCARRAGLLRAGISCHVITADGKRKSALISLSEDGYDLLIDYHHSTIKNNTKSKSSGRIINSSDDDDDGDDDGDDGIITLPLMNALALHRGQISKNFYHYNQKKGNSLFNSPRWFGVSSSKSIKLKKNEDIEKSLSYFYTVDDHRHTTKNECDLLVSNETTHDDDIVIDDHDNLSIDIICQNIEEFKVLYGALKRALVESNQRVNNNHHSSSLTTTTNILQSSPTPLVQPKEKEEEGEEGEKEADAPLNMLSPSSSFAASFDLGPTPMTQYVPKSKRKEKEVEMI